MALTIDQAQAGQQGNTPAQQATIDQQATLPSPNFNQINSTNTNPTTPVNMPPPPVPSTAAAAATVAGAQATGQSVNDLMKQLTPASTPLDDQIQKLLNSGTDLAQQDANKGADTLAMQQQQGVQQKQQALLDANNELTTKTAHYDQLQTTLGGNNGSVETSGVLAAQNAGLLQAKAADIGITQAKITAAQGNLSLAQQQVTNAIDLKYSTIESNIKVQQAQLAALQPLLSKEQSTQALAQQKYLQDQADQVAQKKADETQIQTIGLQAAANGATKGIMEAITNATDPKVALQLATPYLAKVPTQVVEVNGHSLLIDSQTGKTLQDLGTANAIIAARIAHAGTGGGGGAGPATVLNSQGQQITVPQNVAPYYQTSKSGVGWVDASTLQGTAAQKNAIVNAAQKAGLKVITNKNAAQDLSNITDANNKLDTISGVMANLAQPNWLERDLGGAGLTSLAAMAQSDPRKAAAGALQSVGLDMLKAISGVQGFRGNQTAIQQVNDHLPKITDTTAVAQQKIDYIRQLITDRENGLLGTKGSPQGTATVVPAAQIPAGYYQASDGKFYKK